VFGGIIAVGACAFLAGTFLCADARRAGQQNLAEQLRWRTLAVGAVTGIVVFAALIPIDRDAPTLADGLQTQAAPLIVISALAGTATLVLVGVRRFAVARVTALAAVAAVVTGWGVGQYPWLLVDQVTITAAAGAPATLEALLVAVGLAVVIVLPALGYLYKLTQSESWSR
jgi:cytochrome d ubiquinol oxidase subunit II